MISPEDLYYRQFYKEGISKLMEEIDSKLSRPYAMDLFSKGQPIEFVLEKDEHSLPIISFVLQKYNEKGWNSELVLQSGKYWYVIFRADNFRIS